MSARADDARGHTDEGDAVGVVLGEALAPAEPRAEIDAGGDADGGEDAVPGELQDRRTSRCSGPSRW